MDTQWSLHRIAHAVGGTAQGADVAITGPVVTDSREVSPGGLYVARVGETTDGHRFLADVAATGAAAAIVTNAQAAPSELPVVVVEDATEALGLLARTHLANLRAEGEVGVIAVTGSAGKTTTKDLLAHILGAIAPTIAPKLSYNNEVGLPLTVLQADRHTRYLALEMGASGPGHLAYLTEIAPPDVAVELIVGQAHLGGFGSVETLARAKAELVDGLAPGGIAVLNADDPKVAQMAARAQRTLTFGVSEGADVRALDVTSVGGAARFTVTYRGHCAPVTLGLIGAHHVTNALAAIAGALALTDIDLAEAAHLVCGVAAASPHRMNLVELGCGALLIDDSYNANPDSLRAGLAALADFGRVRGGRTVAVIGEMRELGDTSPDLHAACGTYASELGIDEVVSLGGDADRLGEAAGTWRHLSDLDEAAAYVRATCGPGDVVLVKGSNGSRAHVVATTLIDAEVEAS